MPANMWAVFKTVVSWWLNCRGLCYSIYWGLSEYIRGIPVPIHQPVPRMLGLLRFSDLLRRKHADVWGLQHGKGLPNNFSRSADACFVKRPTNKLLKSCCNGQVLAKKMTVLYALSQGQLSKQYHYAACRQDVGNTFKRDLLHAWKQLQDLPEMDTIELLGDEHMGMGQN